jgi:predicted nuclease of predicted toxin-antitoxin system
VKDKIRFHLDEQVDPEIAAQLRRRGIDITTTVEVGLRTSSDESQLDFIRQQNRVIITHDKDFLIIASRTSDYPGIVYCQQKTRSLGEIIEGLVLIYEMYTAEDIVGRVEYL